MKSIVLVAVGNGSNYSMGLWETEGHRQGRKMTLLTSSLPIREGRKSY